MYIINRKGIVYPTADSPDQCKVVGHDIYYYHIRIATSTLDHQGFVVDHEDIEHVCATCPDISGSCESITKKLFDACQKLMGNKMVAFRITVSPQEVVGDAFMEYLWYNQENFNSGIILASLK